MSLGATTQQRAARIAVIGGGAAGLSSARVFTREGGNQNCIVSVFEKNSNVGGVWNYQEGLGSSKTWPMYRGLRTNLPKEVMAFREFPWPPKEASFLTHKEVQQYIEQYKQKFDICVQYESEVKHLKLNKKLSSCFSCQGKTEDWPQIELTVESRDDNGNTRETVENFDAVVIANGHYALPSIPNLQGLNEHYSGRIVHSIEYDDPNEFKGQTVLCIGARASGSDLAREIVQAGAKHVYVSDTTLQTGEPQTLNRVTWVPRTNTILPGGKIQFDHDCQLQPSGIDTIIFCTGYDYSFPFIDDASGDLSLTTDNRRVTPLYEQLWHAKYPNIAFVGLPHSVVPFPFFEFQAEACYNVWNEHKLPPVSERQAAAALDAASGGEGKEGGSIKDTHYLGGKQWDYCRRMSRYAGMFNEKIDAHLSVSKEIYDHAGSQRKGFPGGPDDYRQIRYERDPQAMTWRVLDKGIWDQLGSERKGEFPGGLDEYRETRYKRDYEQKSFEVVWSKIAEKRAAALKVEALSTMSE